MLPLLLVLLVLLALLLQWRRWVWCCPLVCLCGEKAGNRDPKARKARGGVKADARVC